MKQGYFLFTFLFLFSFSQAQIVDIPDANFKNALVNNLCVDTNADEIYDADVDTNDDGEIQITEAVAVVSLDLYVEEISSLEGIEAFTSLEVLNCAGNNLTTLDVSALSNLTKLHCHGNYLTSLNVTGLTNLTLLQFQLNQISNVDLSSLTNLTFLRCFNNNIASLDLSALTSLEVLDCSQNQLTELDVSNLTNLEYLYFVENQLTTLDVNGLENLIEIDCNDNQINAFDFGLLPNLDYLDCENNQLTTLDVASFPNIRYLYFDNNPIQELNLTSLTGLVNLSLRYCQFTSLDISTLANLDYLACSGNQLTELDVSTAPLLVSLYCEENLLTTLDVSALHHLNWLYCGDNVLSTLSLKNGSQANNLDFSGNPNLEYICADDIELQQIQSLADSYGYLSTVGNSYCTFEPGGTYYTIEGENSFDFNLDGCNENDELLENLIFTITDSNDSEIGSYVSNNSGGYSIPFTEGDYTLNVATEHPNYFQFSPESVIVSFPTSPDPYLQNFCLTSAGEFNDLEVVILPLEVARPGFDTNYKIVYKNKGTTIQSGTVFFDFTENSGYMQFVSSNPVHDTLENDMLTWSYTNLQPFETREILVTLNMNAPTDTPPLNGGEDIGYVADIHPYLEDETPGDNNFQIKLTVVNSYDPNDITCLEGETITPEKVGEYVHYLIRFENTGTASAINIVVKDEIDLSKFDISTLVPLSGSHDYFTTIRDNNVVEFIFEDIYLPFDDANNDGYVLFKIKTLESLQLGDVFTSEANIYFDYNFPILTNTASTEVAEPLSVGDFKNSTVKVYPNPIKNKLTITTTGLIDNITITDINGRAVLNQTVSNNSTLELDLSSLSKGMYFVNIQTDSGSETVKVVKQ